MKTFDLLCEGCGVVLGSVTFPDEVPDDVCTARAAVGQKCEACLPPPNPPDSEE